MLRETSISNRLQPRRSVALPVRISGTGGYLPRRTIPSSEFDVRWGKAPGWTARQCGVEFRHVASSGETSSVMAAEAAKSALAAAAIEAGQLDCIVSASSVMEQAIPCLASQVQHRLGLGESGIPAFDINATCLSFLVALDQLSCAIAVGRYRRVLIVSSEMPSVGLNPEDRATAPLFGDGAAAIVLEAASDNADGALLAVMFETYGIGGEYCQFRAGGTRFWNSNTTAAGMSTTFFEMDGRSLYKLAAKKLPVFVDRLFQKANLTLNDVQWVIPHQASRRALNHLQKALGVESDRLVQIIAQQGNQVAASLPSALHHAVSVKGLKRGDCLALLGAGAGVSLGGALLRY